MFLNGYNSNPQGTIKARLKRIQTGFYHNRLKTGQHSNLFFCFRSRLARSRYRIFSRTFGSRSRFFSSTGSRSRSFSCFCSSFRSRSSCRFFRFLFRFLRACCQAHSQQSRDCQFFHHHIILKSGLLIINAVVANHSHHRHSHIIIPYKRQQNRHSAKITTPPC